MEPEQDILEELGLSKNESRTYIALLELGPSVAGKIAKKSKVHRTNVYDSLQKLVDKGLATYFEREERKHFVASDPENLFHLLKEKETRLKQAIPRLTLLKTLQKAQNRSVTIAEGMVAVRNSMLRHLIWNEPIYTIGSPQIASILSTPFLIQFHKKRIAMGIPMYHIYNFDSRERASEMNRMDLTEARILPQEFNSMISTGICGEEVTFRIWGDNSIVVRVKCKELSQAYLEYHRMLWNISVDP